MEKEFVSYKQALALKKLGFDEPCLAWFAETKELQIAPETYKKWTSKPCNNSNIIKVFNVDCIAAPTFSQAFAWFEENHGLYCNFIHEFYKDGVNFLWQIFWYLPVEEQVDGILTGGTMLYGDNGDYETSRDAKIACLEKLIKILNERK